MMDVPKIVLGRLRRVANRGAVSHGDHPDADLLTAFVESALRRRERLHVLEHLAQCPECRETVSVALPEVSEKPGLFQLLKPSSLRSPILRWSTLAVCALVVATVATRHFSRPKPETSLTAKAPISATYDTLKTSQLKTDEFVSKLEPPRSKPESALQRRFAKQRAGEVEADSKALAVAAEKSETGKKDSLPGAAPPATPSPTLLSKLDDRELRDQDVRNELQGSAGKSVNRPAINETAVVETGGASVEVAETTPGKAKEANAPRMKAPAAASGVGGAVSPLVTNKGAESQYAVNLRANLIPRWNLSPQGQVQRSLDGGKSWETIPLSDKAVFRAVAALGTEIWVGGDAGALYRSSDSGQHWTQVTPAVNGESLIADIIGIEFTEPRHVKLTTSDHETWMTTDTGQSWTRNK